MKTLFIATAVAFVALPAFAQDEKSIEPTEVPAAALTAAQAKAAGVTFDKATIDSDEGTETYELSGKTTAGTQIEVDVLADGTIEEVEEEIALDALPAPVKATLDKEMAGFAPTMVEKSTRADGKVIYEFEGQHEGKEVDAEIAEDGSAFTRNDDMAG